MPATRGGGKVGGVISPLRGRTDDHDDGPPRVRDPFMFDFAGVFEGQ